MKNDSINRGEHKGIMRDYGRSITLLLGMIIIASVVVISGCTGESPATGKVIAYSDYNSSGGGDAREVNIDKLEVIHFHATNQCYSCITVGEYAEETLNTYFKDELESGLIVFKHLNGQFPENEEMVVKYGATGSSIWLGVYNGEDFKAEENINVWYRLRNKNDFMQYFKGVVEDKLAGK